MKYWRARDSPADSGPASSHGGGSAVAVVRMDRCAVDDRAGGQTSVARAGERARADPSGSGLGGTGPAARPVIDGAGPAARPAVGGAARRWSLSGGP